MDFYETASQTGSKMSPCLHSWYPGGGMVINSTINISFIQGMLYTIMITIDLVVLRRKM